MKTLKAFLLAEAVLACLLAAQLVASKSYTTKVGSLPCHRLPTNVRPTSYDLHLKFPSLDSDVYEGRVDIAIEFVESNAEMLADSGLKDVACVKDFDENMIVLHADETIEIQEIKLVATRQGVVESLSGCFPFCKKKLKQITAIEEKLEIEELIRDDARQMVGIKLKHRIDASPNGTPGRVSITFKGRLRNDKRGVYVSTYDDGERIFKHIVTQFQPTDARTVFPSFDEPRFRARFSVSVAHPKGLTAYGNTEVKESENKGDQTVTQFATTPEMPVHMVAFTIGEFDEPLQAISVSKHGDKKARKIRVITAPGKRETGRFALEVAKKALEWFELNIQYNYPLNKLDVIAIADHDKDNTESWGLVFVRDTLLWIDDETKPDTRITTAVNIAHVVVHQWFGNLISPRWWSDLWITEGVAAQMALMFVEEEYDFQSEFFVRLATLSNVLQADQAGDLHPLQPSEEKLQTSEQIYGIFDDLEFMKSASLAQMVWDALEAFADVHPPWDFLTVLVKESAYKTVNIRQYKGLISRFNRYRDNDKWEGFKWLVEFFPEYTGVPVINCQVGASSDIVNLQLESFANSSQDMPPIQYSDLELVLMTPVANRNSFEKRPQPDPIIGWEMNNRRFYRPLFDSNNPKNYVKISIMPSIATYFRTRYSDLLYERLQAAIKRHVFTQIDRVQLLDDANSLAQAKLIKPERLKSLLESYGEEKHPGVVLAMLAATNTYRALATEDASPLQSDKAISAIFDEYGFKVSGEEELIMQRARQVVLKTLIEQGNEQVRAAALEAFDEAHGEVALFLREPVYTAVVLSGSSERVNKLLSHLEETKSYEEKIRLVTALTRSQDKEVLTRVKSWLESSGLKAETIKSFLDTISATLSQ